MTLSEIETILEELAVRHQNLNGELLNTLLVSAGWEDKNVKEALALFKQKGTIQQPVSQKPSTPLVEKVSPSVSEPSTEITFYEPDGSEEKELVAFEEVTSSQQEKVKEVPKIASEESSQIPVVSKTPEPTSITSQKESEKKEAFPSEIVIQKHIEVESLTGERKEEVVNKKEVPQERVFTEKTKEESVVLTDPIIFKEMEPQSLVLEDLPVKERVKTKESEIPPDLPLLPFESSPHVWSFSRYKNVFHKDDSSVAINIKPDLVEEFISTPAIKPPVIFDEKIKEVKEDEEISVEKVPLTRGDESLVFLAGLMLLVIILILGYMYSNGRL